MIRRLTFFVCFILPIMLQAQSPQWSGKFEQLGTELPTPNTYRASDGAPGPQYWQQEADYKIKVKLDDAQQKISGQATITYHNNSPQTLTYLWLQLDQNKRASHSDAALTKNYKLADTIVTKSFFSGLSMRSMECGMNIETVTDAKGKALVYTINKTMLRIDLRTPLKSGKSIKFNLSWWYNLNNRMEESGRGGFEYFPADDNYLYTIAQFYPRMAVYDDFEGWQNKQFLGSGEFAVGFGDFEVAIAVPNDHLVAATGELQNGKKVLKKEYWERYQQAKKSFDKPIIIANQADAEQREISTSTQYQTWEFKAKNVRDFAFASSRKFIWDAQAVRLGDKTPLAMSFYPKEGNPLWEKESTKAVINTLKTYSKYSIDYPYPVAQSIHAAAIGMEYPMICFNFGRPYPDGSYNDGIKYNMIGVIIHEVGHNFFPMIVNSDERQWTWMDEGLNSFLEYRTEQECYDNFPSSRGPATSIVNYMKGNTKYIRPIMTNSEQVTQLGNNAYGKPAAALSILRETIMKPALFDKAFKTYSERWAFKHPKPADFFRSMEDASGIDLDWFWRGWFYTIDHVDMAIDTVLWYQMNPDLPNIALNEHSAGGPNSEVSIGNIEVPNAFVLSKTPDYYYWEYLDRLDDEKVQAQLKDKHFYQIDFSNKGGLVMPIILDFEFKDGTSHRLEIPAEVWRYNEHKVSKVFYFDEPIKSVVLDKQLETADVDVENNFYPRKKVLSNFERFKNK